MWHLSSHSVVVNDDSNCLACYAALAGSYQDSGHKMTSKCPLKCGQVPVSGNEATQYYIYDNIQRRLNFWNASVTKKEL